jgi:hypothetical protein
MQVACVRLGFNHPHHKIADHARPQQLQVELRAGKVELRDLNLDEVFLSQHVPNQAFRVVSASVGRLRASISYSTLLTDSASITLEDVEVVVVPHDGSSPFPNQKGQFQRQPPAHDIGRDIVGPPTYAAACDEGTFPEYVSTEGGGADGMDFVASWIEQICATVRGALPPRFALLCKGTHAP